MAWIADVAPQTTIRSVWGNGIRNQIVQIFTDLSEANSHLAALPDGAVAIIGGVQHLKISGAWRSFRSLLVWGGNYATGVTGNAPKRCADCVIPAGFATARLEWDGTLANVTGASPILAHVWLRNGAGTALAQRDVTISPGTYVVVAISANYNPNAAGETPWAEYAHDFTGTPQLNAIGQQMAATCYG